MVQLARERSRQYPNVELRVADATTWAFPREHFDCIASIATFHHLPFEEMLSKMRDALRVGGVLLILDLYQTRGLSGFFVNVLAMPVHLVLRLVKTGRLRSRREAREAWKQHSPNDVYLPLSQVRQFCARVLPGAEVRRHLLWRYSIIWRKEA
jgi:SAM-dependent methyltransferase